MPGGQHHERRQPATEIGSIEVGTKADLVTMRIDDPHFIPLIGDPRHTVLNHLIYSASGADVEDVFVDGAQLAGQGQLLHIDERLIIAQAQEEIEEFIRQTEAASSVALAHTPNQPARRRESKVTPKPA